MIARQGEIIMVDFAPSAGHEPCYPHPAVVLSGDDFNMKSSLTIVAPVTSTSNGYPLHVPIDHPDIHGFACMEQIRAIDLNARRCEHVGQLEQRQLDGLLAYLDAIFDL